MRLLLAFSLALASCSSTPNGGCGSIGQRCCTGGGVSSCGVGLTCVNGVCSAANADLAGADLSGGGGGDMAHAVPDLASSPDGASPCSPNGNCTQGPLCGDACCGPGQYCDSTGINPQCSCGGGPACPSGSSCVSNIPVACGSVCCPPTCPP